MKILAITALIALSLSACSGSIHREFRVYSGATPRHSLEQADAICDVVWGQYRVRSSARAAYTSCMAEGGYELVSTKTTY